MNLKKKAKLAGLLKRMNDSGEPLIDVILKELDTLKAKVEEYKALKEPPQIIHKTVIIEGKKGDAGKDADPLDPKPIAEDVYRRILPLIPQGGGSLPGRRWQVNGSIIGAMFNDVNIIAPSATADNDIPNKRTTLTIPGGGGGGTPAAPDTSVQFNDGGSFGGADFLYSEPDVGTIQFQPALPSTPNTNGKNVIIKAGDGTGPTEDEGTGGNLELAPGVATGDADAGYVIIGAPEGGFQIENQDEVYTEIYTGNQTVDAQFNFSSDFTEGASFWASHFTILDEGNVTDFRNIFIPDWSGMFVLRTDAKSLTAQVADITTTNLTDGGVGQYQLNYVLVATSADLTAGAIQATFAWTDDAGSATATSASLLLTALGRTQGTIQLQRASGNITFAVAHTGIFGTSAYSLYITLIKSS